MRRFVIGDIHGCSKALRTLVEEIDPGEGDELIFLGDYVDRGPDSRGVIDQLIELRDQCKLVTLRGNHEIMLWSVAYGGMDGEIWLESGGKATVTSYGGSLEKIPQAHREFLQSLRPHYETPEAIFVHACYEPHVAMEHQTDEYRYWMHLSPMVLQPHASGKTVYVGHTPQPGGQILDLGYLVCVDTYCFGGGFLTALDLGTGDVIQVDRKGHRRRVPAAAMLHFVSKCYHAVRTGIRRKDRGPNE